MEREKVFNLLVETGQLSVKQMFEAIQLSDNDSDVVRAVVKILSGK